MRPEPGGGPTMRAQMTDLLGFGASTLILVALLSGCDGSGRPTAARKPRPQVTPYVPPADAAGDMQARTTEKKRAFATRDPAGPDSLPAGANRARNQNTRPGTPGKVTFHREPRPLADQAITSDWTQFLGPANDGTSPETPLLHDWPENGPALVWELESGSGYSPPAVQGERLIYFHRIDAEEVLECRLAETGKLLWERRHPTSYRDRFNYGDGPRCAPLVDDGRVYALGAEGKLDCVELETGQGVWQHDLVEEFELQPEVFGVGDTPLVEDDLLVLKLGAHPQRSVAAFDKRTGKLVWGVGETWTPGYASPIAATIHDRRHLLVFAGGGESPSPVGGLLALDPTNGERIFRFPFRSRRAMSINASTPVVVGNRVFLSGSYELGGVLIEVQSDGTYRELWRTDKLGTHWMTAVHKDGYLYGFDGRREAEAELVCIEVETGRQMWRETITWTEQIAQPGGTEELELSPYRGSLLAVDGAFLCLGEWGHLLWLDLSPDGCRVQNRTWLFHARQTWGLPVVSRGLLYVKQNEVSFDQRPPRLLCYDLRGPNPETP